MKKLIYILIILAFGCSKHADQPTPVNHGLIEYKIDAMAEGYVRYYYEGLFISRLIDGDFYESYKPDYGDTTYFEYEPKHTLPYTFEVWFSGELKFRHEGNGDITGFWWVVE